MAEKKTYMVRLPDKRVGRTNNLSVAKSLIDRAGGGLIYSLPFVPWGSMAMDFPTFASTGDLVPYTAGKKRRVDRGSADMLLYRTKQNPRGVRRFGGKEWDFAGTYSLESLANRVAAENRQLGFSVRVVRSSRGWSLYVSNR